MKINNIIKIFTFIYLTFTSLSCTDLKENVYDQVLTENYYKTKQDVINAVFRPFEHAYWSITVRFESQEEPSDQLGTWPRDTWWVDGGVWQRFHYHTWTIDDDNARREWVSSFAGVAQCNTVLDDLNRLNPADFGFTEDQFNDFKSQARVLRAWFYIRLFDAYRNLPLITTADPEENLKGQVSPREMFDFLETELLESINYLPLKSGNVGYGIMQGQWNKAGAASLLVRLYLNAEKWIGEAKYVECETYAEKIINGEYGYYEIDSKWDAPFDWNNDKSNEVIFGFPGSNGRTYWQYYYTDMYWRTLPARANAYFGVQKQNATNVKYALQPSRDIDGNLYNFTLGKFVSKFQKYPDDYRLKLYRNLGNSTREGMFLFGYLEYLENGSTKRLISATRGHELYIRDQVGLFYDADPNTIIQDKRSNMRVGGDMNSGWHFVKYPIYSDGDPGAFEADYAEIRLAEIYYSLAECKFRAGNVTEAGRLLNHVRKRNYPTNKHADYLYLPEGSIQLTEDELLDEWGREFLGESRRRTDLCRWNKFSSGRWWDKEPDADNHTDIYPLHRTVLQTNPLLVQNPGYETIQR